LGTGEALFPNKIGGTCSMKITPRPIDGAWADNSATCRMLKQIKRYVGLSETLGYDGLKS